MKKFLGKVVFDSISKCQKNGSIPNFIKINFLIFYTL